MKAILIVEKNGRRFGYGLAAKGKSREEFIAILHKACEDCKVVFLEIK